MIISDRMVLAEFKQMDLFLSVKTISNLLLPDGCEEDGRDGERGRWDVKEEVPRILTAYCLICLNN